MAKHDVSREWLDAEVTISREELARIMAKEIDDAVDAAEIAKGKKFAIFVKGLLNLFAAEVGTSIFDKLDEEERER